MLLRESSKKLLWPGVVLMAGLGLAWPFQSEAQPPDAKTEKPAEIPTLPAERTGPAQTMAPTLRPQAAELAPTLRPALAATMISDADRPEVILAEESRQRVDELGRDGRDAQGKVVANNHNSWPQRLASLPPRELVPLQRLPPDRTLPTNPTPHGLVGGGSSPVNVVSGNVPLTPGYGVDQSLREHVIRPGDTLPRIAIRYLDDPNRWQEIYEANRSVLPHWDVLPIGAKIVVPDR